MVTKKKSKVRISRFNSESKTIIESTQMGTV